MTDHAWTPAQPGVSPPVPDLLARLRGETSQAHRDLEAALDLRGHDLDRRRVLCVLQRFYGFHAVWEGAMRRSSIGAFFEPRARLSHICADLAAFGLNSAQLAALPLCAAAAPLAARREAAVGSLYVMEGSTLGGQVIGRALAGASWAPPGGLAYFQPYGARTGEMWRSFRAWAQATTPPDRHGEVAAGAAATFKTLQAWMAGAADE
jgi:heme oxygenase (biliverdin-IX-beta and delta-forming)